jgi:hypothetical protein
MGPRMNLLTAFETGTLARARLTAKDTAQVYSRLGKVRSRYSIQSSTTLLWLQLDRPVSLSATIDLLDPVQPRPRKWAQVKHHHHWHIPLDNHQALHESDSSPLCLQVLDWLIWISHPGQCMNRTSVPGYAISPIPAYSNLFQPDTKATSTSTMISESFTMSYRPQGASSARG